MPLCEQLPAIEPLRRGRYIARPAAGIEDLRRAQRLRGLCFLGKVGAPDTDAPAQDADAYDLLCGHVLIEDIGSGALICCFRFLPLASGRGIHTSYAAQFYDLEKLSAFPGRMVEVGRFCIHPGWTDPHILRLAWAAMTAYVDAERVELMFGCSSFTGVDPLAHLDAFAALAQRHLAPDAWRPGIRAPDVFRFPRHQHKEGQASAIMPPLLRSYLSMGGWVSDHAVVDRHLGTMHVFTGLEVRAIPEPRKRLLRALAAQPG